MRLEGTLSHWDPATGTGFITPVQGNQRIAVERAAFPKGGPAPQLGEELWFELVTGTNGEPLARQISRPDLRAIPLDEPAEYIPPPLSPRRPGPGISVWEIVLIGALAYGGYLWWRGELPSDFDSAAARLKTELRQWLREDTSQTEGSRR